MPSADAETDGRAMTQRAPWRGRWGRLRVTPAPIPLAMLGLWLLLSGKLDPFHIGVGVAAVLFLLWQAAGLQPLEAGGAPRLRIGRLLLYSAWLGGQMVLSAVYVARVIIHPRRHLNPRLVEMRVDQPSLVSRVLLANSITLTPGTLTVDLDRDRYIVHALTARTAAELLAGGMARRVAKVSVDEPLAPPQELPAEPTGEER